MKNSAKFVLTLALTVASAASCHKEIAVRGEGSGELTLNPQVDALTKAPIPGEVFPESRTIVLSAYNNGTSANYFQGITFEKNGTSWVGMNGTTPDPKYWPVSGTLDLLAYSADGFTTAPTPSYATKWSDYVTLSVPEENRTKQVDILFAGATGKSASGSALSMEFKHAQAVVAFNAKALVPYDDTKNLGVTINSITVKGVKTYGTVKLKIGGTCEWSDGTAENVNLPGIPSGYNVTDNFIDITTKPFAIGGTGLIVIPQAATSFTVNYTVHYGKDSSSDPINKDETFTYDIPSATWAAGKEYVYQLEFKQDQILVNSTILPWEVIPGGVPVPDKVSATYKDSDATKTTIDLCSSGVPAKLSDGAIVGFDWGDGRYEIIENTTGSEMELASIPHTYPAPPSGSVNIYVRRGTLDFGALKRTFFNLFQVNNSTEVILRLLVFTITRANTTHGYFTVSPESNLGGGETITVTAYPESNYTVDKMTYKEEGSSTENDIIFSSNTGTFNMPECNTTVNVTFKESSTGTIDGHDFVKIGNTRWATTNIGATNPQDYGDLIAWGEITAKTSFSLDNYTQTAKNINSDITPTSGNDVAREIWGSSWRMPTSNEFAELRNACGGSINISKDPGKDTSVGKGIYWCSNYEGKAGCLFCDGINKLFFPAAGYSSSSSRSLGGSAGLYWSTKWHSVDYANHLDFSKSTGVEINLSSRYKGFSVRPVAIFP